MKKENKNPPEMIQIHKVFLQRMHVQCLWHLNHFLSQEEMPIPHNPVISMTKIERTKNLLDRYLHTIVILL